MPSPHVVSIEDWTSGDPVEQTAEQRARLMQRDLRIMSLELARLKQIERAAAHVMANYSAGDIDAHSPMACMSLAELGGTLAAPVQWRRA